VAMREGEELRSAARLPADDTAVELGACGVPARSFRPVHCGCMDAVPVRVGLELCPSPPGVEDIIQFLALPGAQQLGEELGPGLPRSASEMPPIVC
jgi:hypothetical protein